MITFLQVLLISAVLYGMKTLPFLWRIVPRTPLAERIIELLPVALLMAMLLPQVLLPLIGTPNLGSALSLLAVAAAFLLCNLTHRATLGIVVGLAILALAEFL